MSRFPIPEYLHDVFGEQQSRSEIVLICAFSLLGTLAIYFSFLQTKVELAVWQLSISLIIIADILAGFIANFSKGTNDFYAARAKNRLIFIAIHIHILLVAWLMNIDLFNTFWVWLITIGSALVVNSLKGHPLQLLIAACLLGFAILPLIHFAFPAWFTLVSLFFMIKVMFSFAVDHYSIKAAE